MNEELAPVVIFVYKRLNTLRRTISSLLTNELAKESEIYIYSDAAKTITDEGPVNEIRSYLTSVTGFKSLKIIEQNVNRGLADSIISGVSEVIGKHGKAIVLEDDLLLTNNFLSFMNKALDFYQNNHLIFSISGFTTPIKYLKPDDVYFTNRSSSWGWATWKDRWETVNWEVVDYESFRKSKRQRRSFNSMGSDMAAMLDKQMNKKINSWAIRWCYAQFRKKQFTVYPAISKVENIGFSSADATHTHQKFNKFKTLTDTSGNSVFNFTNDVKLVHKITRQFLRPYSMPVRTFYKVMNSLFKIR